MRPLAERLLAEHVEVWYDEFSLSVGDSLRRSIDRGLSQSRFGIVVLSPSFFAKQWPAWELDRVGRTSERRAARRHPSGMARCHPQGRAGVFPSLADKVAATSASGLDEVVRRLVSVIHPQGSTLVVARDHLLDRGFSPPVVTDDWWLDVAAASESNDMEGDWQEPMGWGRWGFPLPMRSDLPAERGWRLACAAMQMAWQLEADHQPITQITRPELIHEFIESQPYLEEACSEHLQYLITYAPQLIIRGFGGQYEDEIEERYQASVAEGIVRRANNDQEEQHSPSMAVRLDAPTTMRCATRCLADTKRQSLRAGSSKATTSSIARPLVLREDRLRRLAALGREPLVVRRHSRRLDARDGWLGCLGMARWRAWTDRRWFRKGTVFRRMSEALQRARTRETFRPGRDARRDAVHRLSFSAKWLVCQRTVQRCRLA